MKGLLKTICITLSLVIGVITLQPIIEANALTKIDKGSESKLSQVVLYEDSSKTIISLVDKEQEEAYKKDILTNPDFKLQEINKVNLEQQGPNTVIAQTLPEGEIMSQKYMYKPDIQRTLDSYAGTGTYARLMSNPVTDATVLALLAYAKVSPWGFAAIALTWATADLMNRQESWWKDSLLMILQNQISCVRVTHIRNTVSDYPAAYLIIERL